MQYRPRKSMSEICTWADSSPIAVSSVAGMGAKKVSLLVRGGYLGYYMYICPAQIYVYSMYTVNMYVHVYM